MWVWTVRRPKASQTGVVRKPCSPRRKEHKAHIPSTVPELPSDTVFGNLPAHFLTCLWDINSLKLQQSEQPSKYLHKPAGDGLSWHALPFVLGGGYIYSQPANEHDPSHGLIQMALSAFEAFKLQRAQTSIAFVRRLCLSSLRFVYNQSLFVQSRVD